MKPNRTRKELVFVVLVFGFLTVGYYRGRDTIEPPAVSAQLGGREQPTFDELVPPFGTNSIAGKIETADGAAAEGVEVMLARADLASGSAAPLHWMLTEADGRFAFDELLDGPYDALVYRPGFRPLKFALELPTSTPPVWRLEAELAELEALPPLVRADFVGRIATPTLAAFGAPPPLEGYEVVLRPRDPVTMLTGALKRRARVTPDGTFRFDELVAATYTMQLLPPWAASSSWPVLDEVEFVHTAHASDASRPLLTIPPGAILGSLENTDGRAIEGALVRLWLEADPTREWPPTESDASGAFRIVDLPPGRYRVSARAGSTTREQSVDVGAGSDAVQRVAFER